MQAAVKEQSRVQAYLAKRIHELQGRKSQSDIAYEAGFANANFISMLKNGKSKLALDRVPDMARALDVDPAYLFRLALEQFYDPAALKTILPLFGSALTENEKEIIDTIRKATNDADPSLTPPLKAKLEKIFQP